MPIRTEVSDGVAAITIDRPDVLNALDDAHGRDLLEAVTRVAKDEDVRCVAITGAGRAFSAGEDLAALSEDYRRGVAPELGRTLRDRYNPLVTALRRAPKPVLAVVNGVAAGAGASIALACDFRIMSQEAKFLLAFVKVGLVPDSGALWFLTQMIGRARTWRLAATGAPLGAEEAFALGVVDEVVPADELETVWRARARELAAGPTRAFALTRSLLDSAATSTLHEQLNREQAAQNDAGRTADHLEGVQAFLAKRPPRFEGR